MLARVLVFQLPLKHVSKFQLLFSCRGVLDVVSYHSYCTFFVQPLCTAVAKPVVENKRAVLISQVYTHKKNKRRVASTPGPTGTGPVWGCFPLADLWSSVQIEAASLYSGAACGSKRSEHDRASQNARD